MATTNRALAISQEIERWIAPDTGYGNTPCPPSATGLLLFVNGGNLDVRRQRDRFGEIGGRRVGKLLLQMPQQPLGFTLQVG
jgi:hypothetical protein